MQSPISSLARIQGRSHALAWHDELENVYVRGLARLGTVDPSIDSDGRRGSHPGQLLRLRLRVVGLAFRDRRRAPRVPRSRHDHDRRRVAAHEMRRSTAGKASQSCEKGKTRQAMPSPTRPAIR